MVTSESIPGRATEEGTKRFQERHPSCQAGGHFRDAGGLKIGSIGLGTHLGNEDEETDAQLLAAASACVKGGINLIDSAISYRNQRAERVLGKALEALLHSGEVRRDEVVLSTKGGYLPVAPTPETDASSGPRLQPLTPHSLRTQLDQSLENLGVETIDVYFIHNPEEQLLDHSEDAVYETLRECFIALEEAVAQNKIAYYGVAVWNAFRVPATADGHLSIARLKQAATEASETEESHFRFLQLPLNPAMPEALLAPHQILDDRPMNALAAAQASGLHVLTSAPLLQGRILEAAAMESTPHLTQAQLILQLLRSCPGVVSCLLGLKQPQHVQEALDVLHIPILSEPEFQAAIQQLLNR